MPLLIGTDEAGYGPNLGPLTITATAWNLPDGLRPEALWDALASVLTNAPTRNDSRLHVADSKQVYSAGRSIASLERSVHAFLRILKLPTGSVAELCGGIGPERFDADYSSVLSGIVDELRLPDVADDSDCVSQSTAVARVLAESGVSLVSIRTRIIFAPEFNAAVAQTDSKGKVLSAATLQLISDAVADATAADESNEATGWVVCDKHGGRNRYDDVISDAFPDKFVFSQEESGPRSVYKVGNLEFCFRTKAEAVLPVALASMVSKYVREVIMKQFNRFWQHHISDLKATKGYPMDAKRFWNDIKDTAKNLNIEKSSIWRCR